MARGSANLRGLEMYPPLGRSKVPTPIDAAAQTPHNNPASGQRIASAPCFVDVMEVEPPDSHPEPGPGASATVAGIPIASAILLPADHLDAQSAWNQHI